MNKLVIPKGVKWSDGPYIVTEYGKIFSLLSMRFIKPDNKGQVYLHRKEGKPGKYYTKRLTAQLYVPNPYNHPIVIVRSGAKMSGHYTSLQWATHKDADH